MKTCVIQLHMYASYPQTQSGHVATTPNGIRVCLACVTRLRMEVMQAATHGTPGLAESHLLVHRPVPACPKTSEPTRPLRTHRATAPLTSAQRPASPGLPLDHHHPPQGCPPLGLLRPAPLNTDTSQRIRHLSPTSHRHSESSHRVNSHGCSSFCSLAIQTNNLYERLCRCPNGL